MPSFSYRALGRDGKEVRGVLQAESETAAVTRIRDNYPVLLSISEQADKKNASSIAIVWELFHDTLIKRLLERHNGMVHSLVQDENGDIEYDGKRFKDVLVDMNSKEDADDCIE